MPLSLSAATRTLTTAAMILCAVPALGATSGSASKTAPASSVVVAPAVATASGVPATLTAMRLTADRNVAMRPVLLSQVTKAAFFSGLNGATKTFERGAEVTATSARASATIGSKDQALNLDLGNGLVIRAAVATEEQTRLRIRYEGVRDGKPLRGEVVVTPGQYAGFAVDSRNLLLLTAEPVRR